jgi:hypothetical protein
MKHLVTAIVLAGVPAALFAQAMKPVLAVPVAPAGTVLPRNTPVALTLNETLSTKNKRTTVGETFTMSVARNVVLNGYIVIPRGARGVGHISYRTRKGGFGKSGKMEIELDYIEVGDTRIPISGNQRVEGEGNSTATIGTFVFLSMIGAGLITGHSAEIPAGKELSAWTREEVPVLLPVDALTVAQAPSSVGGAIAAVPTAATQQAALAAQVAATRPARAGNMSVRCDTCRR